MPLTNSHRSNSKQMFLALSLSYLMRPIRSVSDFLFECRIF
uniref:Uncharacterized protein n=1 Tax=Anguilla anguilla TaxID=7936 RepID=A0A0E9S6K4_ANGAN